MSIIINLIKIYLTNFLIIFFFLHPIGFEPIYNCFEGKRSTNSAKDVVDLIFFNLTLELLVLISNILFTE